MTKVYHTLRCQYKLVHQYFLVVTHCLTLVGCHEHPISKSALHDLRGLSRPVE